MSPGKPIDGEQVGDGEAGVGLHTRLNLETGVIAWAELARHFARGVVIRVDGKRDLVDTASQVAQDNVVQIEQWLTDGTLARASDDDARDWVAREPEFWCVVAAPWVLVQER